MLLADTPASDSANAFILACLQHDDYTEVTQQLKSNILALVDRCALPQRVSENVHALETGAAGVLAGATRLRLRQAFSRMLWSQNRKR